VSKKTTDILERDNRDNDPIQENPEMTDQTATPVEPATPAVQLFAELPVARRRTVADTALDALAPTLKANPGKYALFPHGSTGTQAATFNERYAADGYEFAYSGGAVYVRFGKAEVTA